jgi:hypothetical protein
MTKLDNFIYLIFVVKLSFILLTLTEKYYKFSGKEDADIYKNITYWKDRIEFIFIILMSILLMYIFNPRFNRENLINGEIKLLLFLFGFILVFTAKWNIFIEESKWFTDIKEILV